jgi:hypothetical protein
VLRALSRSGRAPETSLPEADAERRTQFGSMRVGVEATSPRV